MAQCAEHEVTLIAPFVKIGALQRIVAEIQENVRLSLYTRWRPDEIAIGVSDIEVWPILCERQLSSMYLCHHLHAKCYVFDSEASVGSANITSRALGWHSAPNLEIQVRVSASNEWVINLLQELRISATLVNDEIASRFKALALELARQEPDTAPDTGHTLLVDQPPVSMWLPNTRQPSDLYLAYEGRYDEISRGGQATALVDLNYLGIPPGLSRDNFNSCVAAVMVQHQFFVKIHELSNVQRRFGEYRRFVREYLTKHDIDRDAADAWQTCLRWLQYFLADSYQIDTPGYTEFLVRR